MTTATHQWLATAFIPENIIKEVMDKSINVIDKESDIKTEDSLENISNINEDKEPEIDIDILNQKALVEGEKDERGNKVLYNDIEQKVVVLEVKGDTYTGYLALIDDPERVYLARTEDKGIYGTLICDYLKQENAILAINASGFNDPDGHGKGGEVAGQERNNGTDNGEYNSAFMSFGLTDANQFIIGHFDDWDKYKLRDAAQFNPALIINGEVVTAGSNGWGLQPRSCIGQREDGVIMFLVVDGRQVGYSVGATVGDCAKILLEYGAVNASCNDGGSSAVMAYNDKLISVPSSLSMKTTGRWLPNAWCVRKLGECAEEN